LVLFSPRREEGGIKGSRQLACRAAQGLRLNVDAALGMNNYNRNCKNVKNESLFQELKNAA
jgi:hypothetical protein